MRYAKIALIFAFIGLFNGFGLSVSAVTSSTAQIATSTQTETIQPLQRFINGIGSIFETLARWGSRINLTDIAEWFRQTTGKTFSEIFETIKGFFFKAIEIGTQVVQWIVGLIKH